MDIKLKPKQLLKTTHKFTFWWVLRIVQPPRRNGSVVHHHLYFVFCSISLFFLSKTSSQLCKKYIMRGWYLTFYCHFLSQNVDLAGFLDNIFSLKENNQNNWRPPIAQSENSQVDGWYCLQPVEIWKAGRRSMDSRQPIITCELPKLKSFRSHSSCIRLTKRGNPRQALRLKVSMSSVRQSGGGNTYRSM